MESLKCPITQELFLDPVIGDDDHTYEREAITEWLNKNGTSPITRQQMSINSLRTNYAVKRMIQELNSIVQPQQIQYQYQLDVDIRKTRSKPIFQAFGKMIYEVEWINRTGPPIILLKIAGAKAIQEASFYVRLSCHPYIVRTFGLVQCNPGSIMLLQECAPHGDLSELLQENEFKPNERVLMRVFEQICDAMICLADNDIVHGDLACRNVLVFQYNATDPDETLVKLTDFGLTRGSKLYSIVDSSSMSTMTIIPIRYAAPEILRDPNKSNYSEKSDVYSIGVLMWEACAFGELPYSSLHDDNDIRRRKLNNERLQQPTSCSHELWKIVNDCWYPDPKDRPAFKNADYLSKQSDSQSFFKRRSSSRPNGKKDAQHARNNDYILSHSPPTEGQSQQQQNRCAVMNNKKAQKKPQILQSLVESVRTPVYLEQTYTPSGQPPMSSEQSSPFTDQSLRNARQFAGGFQQSSISFEQINTELEPSPRSAQQPPTNFQPLPRNTLPSPTSFESLPWSAQQSTLNAQPSPTSFEPLAWNSQQAPTNFQPLPRNTLPSPTSFEPLAWNTQQAPTNFKQLQR
ncbi:unnamed protein product, partial [Rotaria sp. Silwood2]